MAAFKPCKGCPTPSKCKAKGECAMKAEKGSKGRSMPVVAIMLATAKPMVSKKKAKK